MQQLGINYARAERDEAMSRAVDAAKGRVPKWSSIAFEYVRLFALQHKDMRFIGRNITQAAKAYGLVSPATEKSWGGPINRAIREGVIRKVGFTQDANRHCAIVPEYTA